jgi:uncharacterized cupin superfamily protein
MAKKSKTEAKAEKAEKPAKIKKSSKAEAAHRLSNLGMGLKKQTVTHPWNPNAEMIAVDLGKAMGLRRTAVSIARVPPGKDHSAPHAKHREEEWFYILLGQGIAVVGDEEIEIGAGDFLAFTAPQVVHHLKNIGVEELVFLTGGENAKMDVVDYPAAGKRTVRVGANVTVYDLASGADMTPPKKKSKKS